VKTKKGCGGNEDKTRLGGARGAWYVVVSLWMIGMGDKERSKQGERGIAYFLVVDGLPDRKRESE
jgi:hypothetical protein